MSAQKGAFTAQIATGSAAAAGAGALLSVANPEGATVIITRCVVHITDASDGAGTMDIGIAANGTTLNDTLIDGLSYASLGVFDNIKDKGSNGLERKLWGATEFLTASKASGSSDTEKTLAATVYVEYLRT